MVKITTFRILKNRIYIKSKQCYISGGRFVYRIGDRLKIFNTDDADIVQYDLTEQQIIQIKKKLIKQ